jgi:hypothetical protein
MSLFPITFSIPKHKIIDDTKFKLLTKKKVLSDLIPGNLSTYIYQNETDYFNEYQISFFALTTKKGGWDCMRHYEILANGCIPYFPKIEECPPNTMFLLPKELILYGNRLYEKYKNLQIEDLSIDQKEECNCLILKFLHYMRNNLTTESIAKYILQKTNKLDVKSILFLSGNTSPDYLRCVTLHGFKELFGECCHDFPKVPHIYKADPNHYDQLYGKGITYTNLVDQSLHNNVLDYSVEDDIKNKKYDIIIYGSYTRGMPFYDVVTKVYNSENIILLCGEDSPNPSRINTHIVEKLGHNLFVRELL